MNTKTANRQTRPSTTRVVRKSSTTTKTAKPRATAKSVVARKPSTKSRSKRVAPPTVVANPATAVPVRDSKQSHLIALLREQPGATINQMMSLTGWQAHSVRGTISGVLRKKLGLTIVCESSTDSGEHVYRIVESAAVA